MTANRLLCITLVSQLAVGKSKQSQCQLAYFLRSELLFAFVLNGKIFCLLPVSFLDYRGDNFNNTECYRFQDVFGVVVLVHVLKDFSIQ